MDFLFRPGPVPVQAWVLLAVGWALAAVFGFALYRVLLGPFVEHGEWDPANLRRLAWFLALTAVAVWSVYLLLDHLRPPAYYIVAALDVTLGIMLVVTRRRIGRE